MELIVPSYRILCTGSSGHIGQHLIQKLRELGHQVYCYERYVSSRYGIHPENNVLYGEITDYYAIHQAVKECMPDVVCHLAALGTQDLYAYQHPQENLLVHALGTINVAEAVRDVIRPEYFKLFLHASSSEVYGNHKYPQEYPLKETTPLKANSPYSVGKIAAENYVNYLIDSYSFPATILRNFNTYGFGPARTLIDHTINQMLANVSPIKLGSPNPIRDWLFITDHINAYIKCIENIKKAKGHTFNFCTGLAINIYETIDQIRALTGWHGELQWDTQANRPNDIFALLGTYKKAERIIGWKPEVTLVQGIKKIIEANKSG